MTLCEHYACRCLRAAELTALSDITGKVSYLKQALDAHTTRVRCSLSRCSLSHAPEDDLVVPAPAACAVCSVPEGTPHSTACDWYGIVSRQSLRAPT